MALADAAPQLQSGAPAGSENLAVLAWNMMGGGIQWEGLPIIAEMLGIVDLETLVHQLMAIREYQRRKGELTHG